MWKNIKNYERLYKISDNGHVVGLKRNKFLKNCVVWRYHRINLCKNGKFKLFKIANLVAQHFIPNPNNYSIVNHIDGNKLNDNVDNLEWCTQSQNCVHAYKTGLKIPFQKISKGN